jgi:hypothetical protein
MEKVSDDQLDCMIDFAKEDLKINQKAELNCKLSAFLELRECRSIEKRAKALLDAMNAE